MIVTRLRASESIALSPMPSKPQSLTRNRDYTYDETLVLGKALEEETLRRALAADLVDDRRKFVRMR